MPRVEGMWVSRWGAESQAAHPFFCPEPSSNRARPQSYRSRRGRRLTAQGLRHHRDLGLERLR